MLISRVLMNSLTASVVVTGMLSGPFLAVGQSDFKQNDRKAGDRLTVAEFKQLHAKLSKMSTEKVWSIPWQLSVRKGREVAAKEGKPIFLWISNNGGTHPLGPC